MPPSSPFVSLPGRYELTDVLLSETRGGLMVLTMNRPEQRNALNAALCLELADVLAKASENPAVRAIVLTGAGGAFSVGGDVKAMNEGADRNSPERERVASLRARMAASRYLHVMAKPTVAAIDGPAAGAGLSLALACDFRICARSAKLTTAFAKVGLSGDYGGTYFLPRIVGPAKARELYLLSPVLTGEEAKAIGMVTEVAEPGHVLEAAIAFAAPLAAGPTVTLGRIKRNLEVSTGGGSLAQCFDEEASNHIHCSGTADHKEAAAAFVAKRKPVFAGR
jgi:2-(1,2-epoxy-1,2-dihydrophenyl)acetyl-CoA isomerase